MIRVTNFLAAVLIVLAMNAHHHDDHARHAQPEPTTQGQ